MTEYDFVYQVIEAQAQKTPDSVAVVYGQESLTYKELNEAANQLADVVRENCAGENNVVVLAATYSVKVVVAIFAVMKAGCAFAPIDINYPEQRMQFMLADSQCCFFITDSVIELKFKDVHCGVFRLDSDWSTIRENAVVNSPCTATDNSLVHAIYTSGTTGNPKASTTRQISFMNLMTWFINEFDFSEQTKSLVFTSFSFDLTHRNILAPLMVGGTTHLLDNVIFDAKEIIDYVDTHQITSFNTTPSAFYPLIEYNNASNLNQLSTLQYVFLGGEGISTTRLQPMIHSQLKFAVVNLYGPSECADVSAFYTLTSHDIESSKQIPIGSAVPGCELYVLDENREVVGRGKTGELYISGICIGLGYLNRPKLNEEKFIKDVFGCGSEKMFYRTGDIVKIQTDGLLLFMGRADYQVKYRGFRIELSEIEVLLREDNEIQDAVVIIRDDVTAEQQLVAYLTLQCSVSAAEHGVLISRLKALLSSVLPSCMIPSLFVILPVMPLTANGKLNRAALPKPEGYEVNSALDTSNRENSLESNIGEIWQSLLHISNFSSQDSFFTIGGNSLLVARLLSRIRYQFGVEIAVRHFFEYPTVEFLVQEVLARSTNQSEMHNKLLPVSRAGNLVVSAGQHQLWMADKLIPNKAVYNVPIMHQISGELDKDVLQASLNTLVQRQEILRTTFFSDPHGVYQNIHDWKKMAFQFSNFSDEAVKESLREPFDLEDGPLIRAHLFFVDKYNHILLLAAHHIISDGWTMALLCDELSQIFNAYAAGGAPEFPPLLVQYSDYSAWQQQTIESGLLEKQLEYWRSRSSLKNSELKLPQAALIKSRSYQGSIHYFTLPKKTLSRLKSLAESTDATLFMVLLGLFQILLYRYSDQETIVVGSPVANRPLLETEQMLGFFINMLAFDTTFDARVSFLELIEQVKKMVVDAYENKDVSFEKLVEVLKIDRNLNRNLIFQTVFILNNTDDVQLKLNKLETTAINPPRLFTKFDMVLAAREKNEKLEFEFEYSCELYTHEAIVSIANNFIKLIESVLDTPSAPVNILNIRSSYDEKLLSHFTQTESCLFPQGQRLHQLFERQANKTPDAIAVYALNSTFTFDVINQRANQLARYLQTQGIRSTTRIGVAVPRSIDSIVSFLATLKLGCVYVPLDPAFPAAYLVEIIVSLSVETIIHIGSLDIEQVAGVLKIDLRTDALGTMRQDNLDMEYNSADPIFILSTSGSTGKPKGVIGSNDSIMNRFYWMWERYPFESNDVAVFLCPVGSIDMVWECFGSVLQGIPTLIVSDETVNNTRRFIGELARFNVTRIDLVPAYLQLLLEHHGELSEQLPRLNIWGLNGDAVSDKLVALFCEVMHSRKLIIRYGATEATTTYFKEYIALANGSPKLIADKPVTNCSFYILDKQLQAVPIGMVGDLYVQSPTVCISYTQGDEIAVNTKSYGRLYKTGDVARWDIDGALKLLGRADNVVKIRGHRVILSQLDNYLTKQANLAAAAVVVRENRFAELDLVAFVVFRDKYSEWQQQQACKTLRLNLSQLFPQHMVPSKIVSIGAMPLNPSKKIDRNRLASATLPTIPSCSRHEASQLTALECELVNLWCELLGVDSVDLEDKFFDMGGHSLLAIRLFAYIRSQYQVEVKLQEFYTQPTIRTLATIIKRNKKENNSRTLLGLKKRAKVYET